MLMNEDALGRIADALERISPKPFEAPDFSSAEAFVWHVSPDRLDLVKQVNRVDIDLLVGVDHARDTLLENTAQFARGLPQITRFYGVRAAWENHHWSKRFTVLWAA